MGVLFVYKNKQTFKYIRERGETMNYKQMVLLDELVKSTASDRQVYMIFKMDNALCRGDFRSQEADNLIDVERLKKDYLVYFNQNSEAFLKNYNEHQDDNPLLWETEIDEKEIQDSSFWDEMFVNMAQFVLKINAADYFMDEEVTEVMYNVDINDEHYEEYYLESEMDFEPLIMFEKGKTF